MEIGNRFLVAEIVATFFILYLSIEQFLYLTPSFLGFRFLGVILILIGVAFVILAIVSCESYESNEYIMKMKTIYCSTPLALVVVELGIFVVAVSSQGGGKTVPGRSYKKYEVESYSKWMQNKVNSNWDHYYKKAIVDAKDFVCAEYDSDPSDYEIRADSAFKSGCCEAPRDCKLCSFTNHTTLQRSIKLENDYCNDDCNRWDNDPNTLCFDYQSCKVGFLQDLTKLWFEDGIVIVIIGIVLLLVQISGINIGGFSSSPYRFRALA